MSLEPQTFEGWYRQYRPYWDGNRDTAEYEACHVAWERAVANQINGWAAHDEAVQETARAHAELRASRKVVEAARDLIDFEGEGRHNEKLRAALAELSTVNVRSEEAK